MDSDQAALVGTDDVEVIVDGARSLAIPKEYSCRFTGFLVLEVDYVHLHEFKLKCVKKLLDAGRWDCCVCAVPRRA